MTQNIDIEIVPAECGIAPAAKTSLEASFSGFFRQAEEWKAKAETITDPKLARVARLELRQIRISAEKTRKSLKEESLRMGKAIDGANNILLAVITPIEEGLEAIERAEERRLAAELAERIRVRGDALRPFLLPDMPLPNVGEMTDDQFSAVLADAKLLRDMRVEAARKAERERLEREAEEARERVRIATENERLRKEAEEREKEMRAEREAAAAKQRELEAAAAAERAKAESILKAAEEKAKMEREAAEAIAAEELAKTQAKARAEREAREKAEAEAKALRDAEASKLAAEEEARKQAALAPDREKLSALAAQVRALPVPEITSKKGQQIIAGWINDLALKIDEAAANLLAK